MIDLSSFNTSELVTICMIMIFTFFLLQELYTISYHGKLLMKVVDRRYLAIFWIVLLALWGFFLTNDIKAYIRYRELFYRNSILLHILWIEVCILNFWGAIRHSEIRENGVRLSLNFYRWNKIQSFDWISPNVVQFKITTLFKIKLNHKLIIDKVEDRSKVDEILRRYISS